MKLNWKYTVAWALWILAFGIIEYAAIQDKREGDTFTEHWRKLIGTGKDGRRNIVNWLFRAVTIVGLIWLAPHMLTGAI